MTSEFTISSELANSLYKEMLHSAREELKRFFDKKCPECLLGKKDPIDHERTWEDYPEADLCGSRKIDYIDIPYNSEELDPKFNLYAETEVTPKVGDTVVQIVTGNYGLKTTAYKVLTVGKNSIYVERCENGDDYRKIIVNKDSKFYFVKREHSKLP